MRIISGIYRNRQLKPPASDKVRPTSDRAKETLFNILNNIVDYDGIICADLFCGSGSLGLECISRGAGMCYFIDKDTELVKENILRLDAAGKSKIIQSEVITFLNNENDFNFDLVFCDPPYDYDKYDELIEKISEWKTILILEHSVKFSISERFQKYTFLKKKIGTVNFTFFDFN